MKQQDLYVIVDSYLSFFSPIFSRYKENRIPIARLRWYFSHPTTPFDSTPCHAIPLTSCPPSYLQNFLRRLRKLCGDEGGEAVSKTLAVLVLGVLGETVESGAVSEYCVRETHGATPWLAGSRGETYAGALVVLRKVDLQIWHWMSLAAAFCGGFQISPAVVIASSAAPEYHRLTTFNCEPLGLASFALRSRFC